MGNGAWYREWRRTPKGRLYRARAAFRRRARNREFIAQIKLKLGCKKCGYNRCASALDFDHIKIKKRSVASLTNHSQRRILKEIKRCQLLCANCHREKTLKNGEYYQANNKYFFKDKL